MESFTPSEPSWAPPVYADTRAAWTGIYREAPDIPIQIEAAAYRGRPVSFQIIHPWTKPRAAPPPETPAWKRAADFLTVALFLFALPGAALLALKNLRLGRGDLKGAFRLAFYLLAIRLLIWVLHCHHVPGLQEISLFNLSLAYALYSFGMAWLYYVALEPYLRRLWPQMLVTWVRLLGGRIRDPLIGRDALVGAALGVTIVLLVLLHHRAHEWLGLEPLTPDEIGSVQQQLVGLTGLRFALAQVLWVMRNEVLDWMGGPMITLLLLRILLRRPWPALVGWLVIGTMWVMPRSGHWMVGLSLSLLTVSLVATVLFRFGMLCALLGLITAGLLAICPPEADLTAWYATPTMISLALVAGMAIYGFRVTLAGRPLMRDLLAEAPDFRS